MNHTAIYVIYVDVMKRMHADWYHMNKGFPKHESHIGTIHVIKCHALFSKARVSPLQICQAHPALCMQYSGQ